MRIVGIGRSGEDVVERRGGDGARELLEVDPAVAVGVGLLDHPRELLDGERVAELGHGVRELGRGDEAVAVAVEDGEQLPELVLGVWGSVDEEVGGHERDELGELDEAVGVGVGAGDERVELVGAGLEAQGPEQGAELQLREAAVGVAVEGAEDLPQLLQLVVVQPRLLLLLRRRLADGGGHGAAAPPGGRRGLWRRGGRWLLRGGVDGVVSGSGGGGGRGGVAHVEIGRRGGRRGGRRIGWSGRRRRILEGRWRPGMSDQVVERHVVLVYERARPGYTADKAQLALLAVARHGTTRRNSGRGCRLERAGQSSGSCYASALFSYVQFYFDFIEEKIKKSHFASLLCVVLHLMPRVRWSNCMQPSLHII
jgi:hypothetical protein